MEQMENDGDSYELEFVGEHWNGSIVIESFSERTMKDCHYLMEKYFPLVEKVLKEEYPNLQLVVKLYRS